MKLILDYIGKWIEHMMGLIRRQGSIRRWAAFLNIAVLGGMIYLAVAVAARIPFSPTAAEIGIFGALIFLLVLNLFQFWIMGRIGREWSETGGKSVYDGLTGVFNRRFFEEVLEEEVRRSGRYRAPLTLCFLDLDGFRSYNESFGPAKGDELLERFARFMRGTIRVTDAISRYGGDEFSILLPQTDLLRAEKFVSRVLSGMPASLDCTFSAGLTVYRPGESKEKFMIRAQIALTHAKRDGKKKVCCIIGNDDAEAVLNL